MDWKVFIATFTTIFVAELGDKTQFAAMAVSAGSSKTYTVLLAVVLALAVAGGLGVMLGSVLGRFIDPVVMKNISGLLFIVMGGWIIFNK